MSAPILEIRDLRVWFGNPPDRVDAVKGVDLTVARGESFGLVGESGCGKSTLARAILGLDTLQGGHIRLDGQDISALNPQDRVKAGMGFVPQVNNIFPSMTVEENLEMGAFIRKDDIRRTMEQVYELFPAVAAKRRQAAGELSGGQRQQVAVGRALMTQPSVLMLDEPTAGVSPIVMDELFDRIIEIARTGLPVLMVEQNAKQAMMIADKAYVLVQGANAHTGTGHELMQNDEVRRTFLGG